MRSRVCGAVLSIAWAGLNVQGSDIVIGQPAKPGTGECDPFGCPEYFGLGTFQEVFLRAAFPGTISISELTFFDDQTLNPGLAAGRSRSACHTPRRRRVRSLASAADNIGSGELGFFSGTLPSLVGTGGAQELNIAGTPYLYNPAQGNLLLTIQVTGPSDSSLPLYMDYAPCGPLRGCAGGAQPQTGSAYFGTINGVPVTGGNDIGGLVTQFTYTLPSTVSEPGSALLVVAGALVLGFVRRH